MLRRETRVPPPFDDNSDRGNVRHFSAKCNYFQSCPKLGKHCSVAQRPSGPRRVRRRQREPAGSSESFYRPPIRNRIHIYDPVPKASDHCRRPGPVKHLNCLPAHQLDPGGQTTCVQPDTRSSTQCDSTVAALLPDRYPAWNDTSLFRHQQSIDRRQ
jgi:hypothetical protein